MPERSPLWARLQAASPPDRFVADAVERLPLPDVIGRSMFGADLSRMRGASVLIRSARQLPAARALIELDGIARRVLLCPPDVAPDHLPAICAEADVEMVVTSGEAAAPLPGCVSIAMADADPVPLKRTVQTEWVLFTSGTTGRPKLVLHSLDSLSGPMAEGPRSPGAVWSTFYDIRRYGGLQIFLRALTGGGSLVLSQAEEPVETYLLRMREHGVTHLLGTPTHWRRALMSPALSSLDLRYVRLSGEIADQPVLDRLAAAFPAAGLTHAYASTEAGVGFEVTDGKTGFPPEALGSRGGRDIRVIDGSLRVRSPRAAVRYLGGQPLVDGERFIDTDDMVVERDGRFHFVGRRSGMVNIGGQKVQPEEVEAVILRHAEIRLARVFGRRNPITGMLLVAEIALEPGARPYAAVERDARAACRAVLPSVAVPAMWREVADFAVSPAGKLDRRHA